MDFQLLIEKAKDLPWGDIYTAVGGGALLSIVMQKIKKWFELQSKEFINFILFLLSGFGVLIQTVVQSGEFNTFMGMKTTTLFGVATIIYNLPYIGVRSLTNLVNDAKKQRESQVTNQPIQGISPAIPQNTVTTMTQLPVTETPAQPEVTTPVVNQPAPDAISPVVPTDFQG